MFVEFSLGNFRSFDQPQTLSFRATPFDSVIPEVNIYNTEDNEDYPLLKIVGVYGPNASGKSNIIKGLSTFRDLVVFSLSNEDLVARRINPFKRRGGDPNDAGFFQIVLLLNNKRYRYGFTLTKNGLIASEWLFGPAKQNETHYFKRKGQSVEVNSKFFKEGDQLPQEKLRPDALFLPFCSSYDGEISQLIRNYINDFILFEEPYRVNNNRVTRKLRLTDQLLLDGFGDVVLRWLNEAGMNYADIHLDKTELDDFVRRRVMLFKNITDDDGKSTNMVLDLDRDESEGTKKFYNYIGGLYRLFETGGIFISDEIDNNFHPFLLKKIIALFQNRLINKSGAQLLFTSHDTNLMHPECMRRDQFYFTEKTRNDSTQLYSMADLKGIRNNADFARQYLSGFYGALPHLGNYLAIQNTFDDNE